MVKEGTHPLAEAQTPAPLDSSPARPLTPPPATAGEFPVDQRPSGADATAAAAAASAAAAAAAASAAGVPVEKSLDEVILAYLAQGGEGER